MIVSLIAAIGKNREIGYKNDLLWHIPEDLKRFKQITSGHTVIMGRKTFESIDSKPLPRRKNIIVTSQKEFRAAGAEVVHSVEEAMGQARNDGEVFILGGATLYEQFLSLADKLYLTIVNKAYKADTYFPEYNPLHWKTMEQSEIKKDPDSGIEYYFVTLAGKTDIL